MNQPVRVLNLFTIMNRGGAETMVMNYYRKIDRTKVQFDFMVHRQERGAYDDEIESLGGHIYRLSPISLTSLYAYQKELRAFFKEHSEHKILHAHMSEMAYFIFREAVRNEIPVRICHAHSSPDFRYEIFKEKLKVLPRLMLVNLIRPLVTDKFCCSEAAGHWLFGNTENLVQLNNAVDAKLYRYNPIEAVKFKAELGWTGKIVWGHIGRLIKIKNQSFIIDLFSAFHQKNRNSILILIGDGPDRNMLERKIKSLELSGAAFLLGKRDDIPSLLQGIDLFLFPSLYEGLPVSLVEAQAAGVPCVVSDRISTQTHIVDSYYPVSLNASLETWGKVIEHALLDGKQDTYSKIKERGFDITENASWLCDFYLKKYQEYE